MSTNDLKRFVFGVPDKSVNNFDQKITGSPTLDSTTYNISSGIKRGLGVRYATAPLGGHNNTETPAANQNNGIQRSEITGGALGLTHRERIYGIIPITMAPYDGAYPKANKQYYAFIVGLDNGSDVSLDVCLGSTLESSVYKQYSTLVAGLAASSYRQESPLSRLHKTEMLNLPQISTPTAANMQEILKGVTDKYFTPHAQISVPGKRIPYSWMLARSLSTPTDTIAPNLNLWAFSMTALFSGGGAVTVLGGSPSEIITRGFVDNDTRFLKVFCINTEGRPIDLKYLVEITPSNTAAVSEYNNSSANYTGLTGAVKSGSSLAYGTVFGALVNDPGSFTNSIHSAVLVAGEKPLAIIYQDWLKAANGMMPRWLDLTSLGATPRVGIGALTFPFDTESAYVSPSSIQQVGANTGVLRINTTYKIGFSYYNKLIDYETNVFYITTKEIVFTDLESLLMDSTNSESVFWQMRSISNHNAPWEFSAAKPGSTDAEEPRMFHINDFEYRFYFQENGTSEWLPAGNIDAVRYWFLPDAEWGSSGGPTICTGPAGSLPGGQPNGFIDYSPLPKQRYICTQTFQQRAFWWSETSMHFSYQNNIYAYPTRNTVSAQTGKWRGGIVHVRTNENIQQSRLVVFGDSSYSARFTGKQFFQSVRISAGTVGQFAVDGSDFVLDYLCDATAFSYRSAVVAEGVLYFWGPQGVYRDDGRTEPKKISGILEPDINDYVDMGRDDEVHCVYIKRCNEIVWFYPPKVTDATYPTYGLAYNVESGNFYPYKFKFQVDSAQNLKIENDETPDGVDGDRVLLHCRETSASTVQRTYFFDDIALAGDQGPASQLSVISFSTPVAGTRRLTLASGSAGITASGIVANDYISFQNVKGYAPGLTLAPDMIAKITAVNNASNYIDILLPDGGDFDASATLTGQTAFPVYHRGLNSVGLNGIPYLYQTNYWLADGLYQAWVWQYLYFLFKYPGIPQPMDPFHPTEGLPSRINLTFESTSGDSQTDVLSLINNTKDHCQIHHPLYNHERSANGQALRFALSGIYIGDHWTFEYLEAHCLEEFGFTLKEFEG